MADAHATGQQPPLKNYFVVWGFLFQFSAYSYMTDFLEPGYHRWALNLVFMFQKAGFIVAIFMHKARERLALTTCSGPAAISSSPIASLVSPSPPACRTWAIPVACWVSTSRWRICRDFSPPWKSACAGVR